VHPPYCLAPPTSGRGDNPSVGVFPAEADRSKLRSDGGWRRVDVTAEYGTGWSVAAADVDASHVPTALAVEKQERRIARHLPSNLRRNVSMPWHNQET